MSDQVKHPDRNAADAESHHHIAELRHRGVSQDAFDVGLRDSNERGKNGRDCADPDHESERYGSDSSHVMLG